jgi:carbon-monoxide dehydrogenase medium subunit
VIPASFEYAVAESLEHASALLGSVGDAKLLAGGHSLVPAMRLRFARPELLVDLGRLPELRGVRLAGDELVIGAMTRHADLMRDPLVAEHCPLLAQAAALVGDRQIRHRGTIGGSVAHADPNGDLGTVLLALGATLIAARGESRREIPADGFFAGWLTTTLESDEVLAEIRVRTGAAGTYLKHSRRSHDWATAGVAAVRRDGRVSVAMTSMGPTPLRARAVEAALAEGAEPEAAATLAAEGTSPVSDVIASADYRTHLACVLTRRALEAL